MTKRLICDIHDDIINEADVMLSMRFPQGYNKDIKDMARKIKKLAKEARKRGQAMEDRLFLYRNAVESLGFKK